MIAKPAQRIHRSFLNRFTGPDVTIQEFENQLKQHTRIKFASKILATLKFVENHESYTGTIGICWCQDGRHFLCNSKILGNFLSLKSNSINTNFREHGFTICQHSQAVLKSSGLPDFQHWKKRVHPTAGFHKNTTMEEADRIGIIKGDTPESGTKEPDKDVVLPSFQDQLVLRTGTRERPVIMGSVAVNAKGIPDTLMMILEHNRVVQLSVQMIMEKVQGTDLWKNQMIVTVTRDWVTAFGAVESVSIDMLLDNLLASMEVLPRETIMQLRANVEYLVGATGDVASQGRGDAVRFDDYLGLMIRYGPSYRFARTIFELAAHDMADPFLDLSLNSFTCLSQSQGCPPNFKSWFHPGLNARTAEMVLNKQSGSSWMVRPSSIPNMFTLQCKMLGRLIASHITYDGLADDEKLYSVRLDNNQVRYAGTWNQLLFTELELRPEDCAFHEFETTRVETEIVDARDVIAGNREALVLSLEPLASIS